MAIQAPRWSSATLAAAGALASSGTLYLGVRNLLVGQADRARQIIPKACAIPPRADGLYTGSGDAQRFQRGMHVDLHLMIFGDSTATGYGCLSAAEVPGALIATALAQRTGLRIRLSTKAIVGATSKGLAGQVDAMFVAGPPPDVAVIMVGANDVTSLHGIAGSAQRLHAAVRRLRAGGAVVLATTCPDLGAVTALPQPLRWVAHTRARQLARAQAHAVKAAGGITVPFADFRAPQFRHSPELLLAQDQYHPSAAGYALAATQVIPPLCAALDRPDSRLVASSD
ncbi:SGNH/GDSL hydrolase family protein [Mycolicibacter minnesotensis]